MSLINIKFGELKIFSIDLIKKEEKLMYSFIVEFFGLNENEEVFILFIIYVLVLNKRYIMLVNIDINFKNKFVFIVDFYNKFEFYLDLFIIDNYFIFEILFVEIKKFKNRDYLFIKIGRISLDEKRYYFNLGKDIINKIEILLIIFCEELI